MPRKRQIDSPLVGPADRPNGRPIPPSSGSDSRTSPPAGRSSRWIWPLLAGGYALFILYSSWLPFDFVDLPDRQSIDRLIRPSASGPDFSTPDWTANVLLAIPLGLLAMGALCGPRRPRGSVLAALAVLAVAFLVATTAEIGQAYLPGRTPSRFDILAQLIGAGIGLLGFVALAPRVRDWYRSVLQAPTRHVRAMKLLVGYAAVLAVYQLLPLNFTLDVGLLWSKRKAGMINVVPLADLHLYSLYAVASKIAIMVPIGYLARLLAAARPARPAAAATSFLAAMAYVGAIELAQVLVLARHATTTDLLWGTAGAIVGLWLARRIGPLARGSGPEHASRRRLAARALLVAVVAVLAWSKWRPLEIHWPWFARGDKWAQLGQWPLLSLLAGEPISAATHLWRTVVAFAGLGAVLAAAFESTRLRWALLVAICAALELAQVAMPERLADPSMLLVSLLAGWLGLRLYPPVRRDLIDPSGRPGRSLKSDRP
jgi:VanZ family protein